MSATAPPVPWTSLPGFGVALSEAGEPQRTADEGGMLSEREHLPMRRARPDRALS